MRSFFLAPAMAVALLALSACQWDDDYVAPEESAIVIAYHGYTGSYEAWVGASNTGDVASDSDELTTGLRTLMSAGHEREYYIHLPGDTDTDRGAPYYDLLATIGDDAIFVAPNGLPDSAGTRSWGGSADFDFFADLLIELDALGVNFDPNRVFVAGHSNGGGHGHALACAFGDVIRGIAVAAGNLLDTNCVGAAGIMLMQGSNDPLSSPFIAEGSRDYWVLYNGWEDSQFSPSTIGPCDDYSFPGEANSDYPVLWCSHTQGHAWPDFASQTAWDFFNGMADAEPSFDEPDGGGVERAKPPQDTTFTFQLDVPADMRRPLNATASLRAPGFLDNPTCASPDIFLTTGFSVDGAVVPGQVSEEITIPVTYFPFGKITFPSDWLLTVTVYVEGGATGVIPSPGIDHDANILISLVDQNAPVVVGDVMTLEPVADLCGIGG